MFNKIILFITGYILMTIGLSYIIVYINLLTFGFSFYEYFKYISTRYECYLFLIGLIMVLITMFRRK